jgi:hypothetical protein
MMANLQAIARGHSRRRRDWPSLRPGEFVEVLNEELTGRFGDNRYATLFWCEYEVETRKLQYINAGNPSPILVRSNGAVERLASDGFPLLSGLSGRGWGMTRTSLSRLSFRPTCAWNNFNSKAASEPG